MGVGGSKGEGELDYVPWYGKGKQPTAMAIGIIILAALALASLLGAIILYVVDLDRHANFFNDGKPHDGTVVFNTVLAFACALFTLGEVAIIYLAASRGPLPNKGTPPYKLVEIWEGILLFLFVVVPGVYMVWLAGAINIHCERYTLCCPIDPSSLPAGSGCPPDNRLALWDGVLSMTIITFILGVLALMFTYWRSVSPQ